MLRTTLGTEISRMVARSAADHSAVAKRIHCILLYSSLCTFLLFTLHAKVARRSPFYKASTCSGLLCYVKIERKRRNFNANIKFTSSKITYPWENTSLHNNMLFTQAKPLLIYLVKHCVQTLPKSACFYLNPANVSTTAALN